jgi:protein unc-119
MPNSRNTWEVIYTLPPLDPDVERLMIENPFESQSDSFYFVGNKMVMHNKAEYRYEDLE